MVAYTRAVSCCYVAVGEVTGDCPPRKRVWTVIEVTTADDSVAGVGSDEAGHRLSLRCPPESRLPKLVEKHARGIVDTVRAALALDELSELLLVIDCQPSGLEMVVHDNHGISAHIEPYRSGQVALGLIVYALSAHYGVLAEESNY